MPDPRIISLDIETYGVVEGYPQQTVFHPKRMEFHDKVPISEHILTCAITIPIVDPRNPTNLSPSSCGASLDTLPSSPDSCWDGSAIASLVPGETMVFDMWKQSHRRILGKWLRYADTIMGMNLPFDLQCLRQHTDFRFLLGGHHTLIDLSYVNYLDSEARPERSLKTIGPILGTHIYGKPKGTRYKSREDPELHSYNGQDTHNTMIACAELAKRIGPHPWKLSPWCIKFYSDAFWSCIRMAESGIPIDSGYLHRLKDHLLWRVDRLYQECLNAGVMLSGEGSQKSKDAFIHAVIDACPQGTINHPLLQFTEKTKKVKFDNENRNLLKTLLPPGHPYLAVLEKIGHFTYFQKLLSDYLWPLIHHARRDETDIRSIIIPPSRSGVGVMYPTWYPVPAPQKDGGGDEGGTIQGRITCKFPKAQTFPPIIKRAETSLYGESGCIVSMDLNQAELRGAALLSGDESMVSEYAKANPDLHGIRAVQVYSEAVLIKLYGEKFRKNPLFKAGERQDGKQLNFADLFLATAGRMQRTILELRGKLYPLSFFENIERSRYVVRKGLSEWQYELACKAEKDGVITMAFTGQSRYFTGFHVDHVLWHREHRLKQKSSGRGEDRGKNLLSEIVNFPVQTFSGNTLLRIKACMELPHLNYVDPPYRLYINVYDALRFDCKRRYVPELLQKLDAAVKKVETEDYWAMMQDYLKRKVPLTYEAKVED